MIRTSKVPVRIPNSATEASGPGNLSGKRSLAATAAMHADSASPG